MPGASGVKSTTQNDFRWLDLLPAASIAAWNIASAPFLNSALMNSIRGALGTDRFVLLFAAVSAVFGLAVLLTGWLHLREDRRRRLALIGAGLALVVVYALLSDRGEPREEVIERLHFVTYGTLAAALVVPWRRLGRWIPLGTLAGSLVIALADETMQWLVPVRVGEFFDLGLNVYAAICGTLVGLGLFSNGALGVSGGSGALRVGWRPEGVAALEGRPTQGARRALAMTTAVALLGTAAFVDAAHVGHLIENDDLQFRSFFDEDELRERNRRAAARWREIPPGPLTPWEREDWFRTEAGWHTRARNLAWAREDWAVAAVENRILERYYSAFLELPAGGGAKHRFPAETTAQLEQWAEGLITADATSEATPRIWLGPTRPQLWTATLLAALGALWLGRARSGSQDE